MAKLGKRASSLIALGAALLVLAGVFILVKVLPSGGGEETPSPAAETISLYACDEEDIAGFTLDTADGSCSVTVDRQEKTVTKDDESTDTETVTTYAFAGYPDVPVDTTNAGYVLTNASKLQAVSIVESETPADLSPYGLDPANATATIDFTDGSSMAFYVGNKTGAGNSCYMMKQGDPAVYEVKLLYANRFSYTLDDLVKTDVLPAVNTVSTERILLKRAGQPDIEAAAYTTPEGQAHIGVAGFKVISPFERPRDIDADTLDTFLQNVAALTISGVASLNPDDKDGYGLTEPRIELLEKDADNTLHVYFGDDTGDGAVACMVEGYAPIYTVDKDSISFLEELKAPDLADKFILLPLIDDVKAIDVYAGGKNYALTIERRTEKAEEEGEEDTVVETFFLDGVQKDDGAFRDAYQVLIGVRGDTPSEDSALTEGETAAAITYTFIPQGTPPMTVSYHVHDVDFYGAALDGEPQALVAKRKVDAIADALQQLEESADVEK